MYRDDLRPASRRARRSRRRCPPAASTARPSCSSTTCSSRAARIRAALDALAATSVAPARCGWPCSSTAVTASCPIRADFVGKNLPSATRRAHQRAPRRGRRRRRGDDRGGETDEAPARHEDLSRDDAIAHPRRRRGHGRHVSEREVKKLPTLRGKTVVNLFFEDSTRTRISFEAAAKRLSRRRHQLQRQGLERLEGREPEGHRADAAGDGRGCRRHPPRRVRRSAHPRDERLDRRGRRQRRRRHARASDAGAARRVHDPAPPARRRQSRGRDLDGVRVTIVGDILHSRVARSNVWLLDDARRRGHARRAADPGAGRHVGLAGSRRLRPRRGDRRRRPTSS